MRIIKDAAISENGLIFNPFTGDSFKVNILGLEIIKLMKIGIENEGIKDIILKKYDIDRKTLDIDYNDFINCLSQNRLIESELMYFDNEN